MKPGQNPKQRSRGRSNNNGGGGGNNNSGGGKRHMPPRNQTFDSSGPDIRIRGNAHQVLEKYLSLARDAAAQGDRIAAENFYQHAEHYFRVINAQNGGRQQQRPMATPADDHSLLAGDMDGEDGEQPQESGDAQDQEQDGASEDGQDGDNADDGEDEAAEVSQEAEVVEPERPAVVNG